MTTAKQQGIQPFRNNGKEEVNDECSDDTDARREEPPACEFFQAGSRKNQPGGPLLRMMKFVEALAGHDEAPNIQDREIKTLMELLLI